MSNYKENKLLGKYFIKDESLSSVDDGDAFNHRDISKILCNIIDTTEPPYNIAVIGKWGLGKSSLINMAINKYKSKNDEFAVHEINAWKYEKEALKKVFLRQLWEGVDGKKVKTFEKIKQRYADIINAIWKQSSIEKKTDANKKISIWIVIVILFSLIIFSIYKIIQGNVYDINICTKDFWLKVFLSYCKNVVTILLLPILLILSKQYLSEISSGGKRNIALNIDVQSTDEYEMLLEDKIKEKLDKNKNYRIITVIDDLDRLSINKIVEALDAIKAFVGFDRCIFIVPFDDAILKKALEKGKINGLQSDNEIIESELILDKLFQFKIYLPPILKYDIKEYAMKLIKKKSPDFLIDYCSEKTMNDLIKNILIHSGVTTPRQVKKIINIFMSNYIIAYNREILGKVENDILTSDSAVRQIAKISVLQADFNEFYDLLFTDFNYINLIIECYQKKFPLNEISKNLKCYFEEVEGITCIKDEYLELINFLIWTNKYKTDHIDQFMFLAQEKISRKTGDANFRKFINAVESKNITLVSEMIEDNSNNIEILNYKIEDSFDYDLPSVLEVAINTFHLINKKQSSKIATSITDKVEDMKCIDVEINYGLLIPQNIIQIYEQSNNENFGKTLVTNYIEALNDVKSYEGEYLCNAVSVLVEHTSIFKNDITNKIQDLCVKIISNDEIKIRQILDITEKYADNDIIYKKYFGIHLFNRVFIELNENNLFEEYIFKAFTQSFNILINNIDVNELIEKILDLFEYPILLNLLSQILTNSVSRNISKDNATHIAQSIISIEYENEITNSALEILNKISYEISEETADKFDEVISSAINKELTEGILVYTGENSYFEFLPNTINTLIENIFESEKWDGIFGKVECYFTKEQKTKLQKRLLENSVYQRFNTITPNRLVSIYKILNGNDCNNELINICIQNIINQFNSYYNQIAYFNFVSELIGYLHESINSENIVKYLNIITDRFSSNINGCIQAIQRVQDVISDDKWDIIMPLLIKNVSQSNYDMTFSIIEDNLGYFNKEKNNLTQYVNFLVDTIDISNDSNKNVKSLGRHFSKISRIDDLLQKCAINNNINSKIAIEVVSKLMGNMKIDDIANSVIKATKTIEVFNFTTTLLPHIKSYELADILEYIAQQLTSTSPIYVIERLLEYCNKKSTIVNVKSVLTISSVGLEHVDEFEVISNICNQLSQFGKNFFAKSKNELAKIIYPCFNKTSSDKVKKSLLRIVSELKIKRQFKALLNGQAEADYYINNIK